MKVRNHPALILLQNKHLLTKGAVNHPIQVAPETRNLFDLINYFKLARKCQLSTREKDRDSELLDFFYR